MNYNANKILKLFSTQTSAAYTESVISSAVAANEIPPPHRGRSSWTTAQIPLIGERFGFLNKLSGPQVWSVFVTKGGVLKTSITLNLARMTALHNLKVLVVGLDMQGDVSNAMGLDSEVATDDFQAAIKHVDSVQGLANIFSGEISIAEVIRKTDIPNLHYIPETPELVSLEKSLSQIHRREYWLEKMVVQPLKSSYDLIILDCSPNWNLLTTNALVSSDLLISPLECKIFNFRNLKVFDRFIRDFKTDMNLNFKHIYIPTRWNKQRKLSSEILSWYKLNLTNCFDKALPESQLGEEASALNLSVSEYKPGSDLGLIYNQLLHEIFERTKQKSDLLAKSVKPTTRNEVNHGAELK